MGYAERTQHSTFVCEHACAHACVRVYVRAPSLIAGHAASPSAIPRASVHALIGTSRLHQHHPHPLTHNLIFTITLTPIPILTSISASERAAKSSIAGSNLALM